MKEILQVKNYNVTASAAVRMGRIMSSSIFWPGHRHVMYDACKEKIVFGSFFVRFFVLEQFEW